MNSDDLSNIDAPPPEEPSNRTFLMAAGILGGIVLLSIACLAGYAFLVLPSQRAQQQQAATAQAVQNEQVQQAATAQAVQKEQVQQTATAQAVQNDQVQQTATAQAAQNDQVQPVLTATTTALSFPTPTLRPLPTKTPMVVQPTVANTATPDPVTATVAAALTQAALAQLTHVPTSTALPATGFADEFPGPTLVVVAMALVAVIFLARRLRESTSR